MPSDTKQSIFKEFAGLLEKRVLSGWAVHSASRDLSNRTVRLSFVLEQKCQLRQCLFLGLFCVRNFNRIREGLRAVAGNAVGGAVAGRLRVSASALDYLGSPCL